MFRKWLFALIIATGLIHLVTLSADSEPLHWVFKLAPMLLIIAFAAGKSGGSRLYATLIVAGLVFGIAGDACLLMDGDSWFTAGLGSFLTGHVLYAAAMLPRLKRSWLLALSVVPIAAYSSWMAVRFHESLMNDSTQSGLWLPVLVYVIVLSLMCWLALMTGNGYAAAGAVLFVASDSILAWNKFVHAFSAAGFCIMLTYFAAQLLIACSIGSGGKRRRTAAGRAQLRG
ncbi:lysoplasmalogenase [Paenibacillus protaetiae]|uniref:lysoplasmalogenase n=1 Tax=Paenibacillus protaetiae TaxID=2509456 RepID=UPI0013EB71D9|nr:lysoplasmalogenase [Paenibacillus protaetiae]